MKTRLYLMGLILMVYVLIIEAINKDLTKLQYLIFTLGVIHIIISVFTKQNNE